MWERRDGIAFFPLLLATEPLPPKEEYRSKPKFTKARDDKTVHCGSTTSGRIMIACSDYRSLISPVLAASTGEKFTLSFNMFNDRGKATDTTVTVLQVEEHVTSICTVNVPVYRKTVLISGGSAW
jgi:hypothetical protein